MSQAVPCHVARVNNIPVSAMTGKTVNKNTATIQQMLTTSTEPRVMQDPQIPNTANNPTIKDYIMLEAASGYIATFVSQNMIITYDHSTFNALS